MASQRVGRPYEIRDGKIRSERCEVNLASHCNLSCRSCSHLSPMMARSYAEADVVLRDLIALGRHYRAETVRLLGGEPLLHPNLLDVVAAVRASGIADRICVVTNGVLLWRMPEAFWEQVDQVQVSVYPGKELAPDRLEACRRQAEAHGVKLRLTRCDRFRVSYSELGTADRSLVGRIYGTCQIAHVWRCHTVHSGYFYKCSQSLFLPQLLGPDSGLVPTTVDGIRLVDSPTLGRELLAYLTAEEPLASCRNCLGSAGNMFQHEQVPRAAWREPQRFPTEALIDMDYLRELEDDPRAPSRGRTPLRTKRSHERVAGLGKRIARSPAVLARLAKRVSPFNET